jgi:hypothetical protein
VGQWVRVRARGVIVCLVWVYDEIWWASWAWLRPPDQNSTRGDSQFGLLRCPNFIIVYLTFLRLGFSNIIWVLHVSDPYTMKTIVFPCKARLGWVRRLQTIYGSSLIYLPSSFSLLSNTFFLSVSSIIPLTLSTCPLAFGCVTDAYLI